MNGLIRADMEVFGIRILLQRIKRWDLCVLIRLARPDGLGFAKFLSFFTSLVAPRSGDNVVGRVIRGAEIQRESSE